MTDVVERLRIKAGMIELGDKIPYGSDSGVMREAADEIERLREALHTIVCNTEPDAIKHRDYDHLAKDIYDCARAALGERKE